MYRVSVLLAAVAEQGAAPDRFYVAKIRAAFVRNLHGYSQKWHHGRQVELDR